MESSGRGTRGEDDTVGLRLGRDLMMMMMCLAELRVWEKAIEAIDGRCPARCAMGEIFVLDDDGCGVGTVRCSSLFAARTQFNSIDNLYVCTPSHMFASPDPAVRGQYTFWRLKGLHLVSRRADERMWQPCLLTRIVMIITFSKTPRRMDCDRQLRRRRQRLIMLPAMIVAPCGTCVQYSRLCPGAKGGSGGENGWKVTHV
jgi:hypothetical protein